MLDKEAVPMKIFAKTLIIFLGLIAFLALFTPTVKAYIPIGTGSGECTTTQNCIDKYGAGRCINRMCVYPYSDMQAFQEELDAADNLAWWSYEAQDRQIKALTYQIASAPQEVALGPGKSLAYTTGGALGTLSFLFGSIYANPPASSVEYLADLGRNAGLVKPAYAQDQGIGFAGLHQVLEIWKAFRNVAYAFFVVIFVITGLLIMFRVKIDPKTVVTIQSAIPRFIIALLMVTFSYAIGGLLIDLMYVSLLLIFSIFHDAITANLPGIVNQLQDALYGGLGGWGSVLKMFGTIGALMLGSVIKLLPIFLIAPILGLFFVVLVGFFFIRITFMILIAYVQIILNIVFAPIKIVISALPGSRSSPTDWIYELLKHIVVLPTVFTMLLLAGFFLMGGPFPSPATILDNLKNLIDLAKGLLNGPEAWLAGWWNIFSFAIQPLIGLGIFLLTPSVTGMVSAAFARKPFDYGTALGKTLTPVTGPVKYGWGTAKSIGTDYLKQRILPARGRGEARAEVTTTPSRPIPPQRGEYYGDEDIDNYGRG